MSAIAAIRTNRWTEDEERLCSALRPVFGEDLVVVFHDRPAGVEPPIPVIDISSDWVAGNGLAAVPDWGWRCGDYFYYALRAERPGYDHYWMVEPDVFFTGDAAVFFAAFSSAPEDVLGYNLGLFTRDMRFTRGLPGMVHHRAIFALTRLSGRALDMLVAKRRMAGGRPVSVWTYPNDEIFVFSHAAADPGLTSGRLEGYAPEWFEGSHFTTDPDLLLDQVMVDFPAGRVLHPVRGRQSFLHAVAKRIVANVTILGRYGDAIDHLKPSDLDEIVRLAQQEIVGALHQIQTRQARRRRRREARDT